MPIVTKKCHKAGGAQLSDLVKGKVDADIVIFKYVPNALPRLLVEKRSCRCSIADELNVPQKII
ncbi:MAG: hypothetical protein GWN16_01090 [Calditrichae bacterium]|nr:hypothetical protein [Calditrichia bacterium]